MEKTLKVQLTQTEALIVDEALAALVSCLKCNPCEDDRRLINDVRSLQDRLMRDATACFALTGSSPILIKIHEDPGHRWGEVSMQLVRELGIEEKISRYSYRNGDAVYLEEDVDLAELCVALDKAERKFQFVLVPGEAAVRSYPRFK